MKKILFVLCLASFCCLLHYAQAQNAQASFRGGAGTETPDQFPGIEGAGWFEPWKIHSNSTMKVVAAVKDAPANPRLIVQMSVQEGALEYNNGSVCRRYENAQAPHTIRFKIRVDRAEGCDSPSDFVGAFGGGDPRSNFTHDSTWAVRTIGREPSQWRWAAYHGEANGGLFEGPLMKEIGGHRQGMEVKLGTTYEFTITNRPVEGSYDVMVSDGSHSVTSEGLLYRGSEADWSPLEAGVAIQSQANATGDLIAFSVFDVEISPQP